METKWNMEIHIVDLSEGTSYYDGSHYGSHFEFHIVITVLLQTYIFRVLTGNETALSVRVGERPMHREL